MSNNKDAFNVSDLTAALNEENRADFVNAIKCKSLARQHSDTLESLSPVMRKRVEVLKDIQVTLNLGAKFEVRKFDGTGNFILWQRRVKDVLAQQGLSKALRESKPVDMDQLDWDELKEKVAGTICWICMVNTL